MFEFIRKGLLTGFGLVLVTRKKLQETTDELVGEGKMTREEAEKLMNELLEEGSRQWEDFQDKLNDMVRQSFAKLDIGSKKEFTELQERVGNLEKHLKIVEERLSSPTRRNQPGDK